MKAVTRAQRYPRSPVLDITVTQEALTDAIERNSSHCVIAESIKSQVPWATKVSVDLQTIRMTDSEKRLRFAYLTPRSCQMALVYFDQGRRGDLHPFKFRLTKAHIARMADTPAPKAGIPAATNKGFVAHKNVPRKSVLVSDHHSGRGTIPPRRVGGRLPPKLSASSRREFGMRGLSIGYPVGSPERGSK